MTELICSDPAYPCTKRLLHGNPPPRFHGRSFESITKSKNIIFLTQNDMLKGQKDVSVNLPQGEHERRLNHLKSLCRSKPITDELKKVSMMPILLNVPE